MISELFDWRPVLSPHDSEKRSLVKDDIAPHSSKKKARVEDNVSEDKNLQLYEKIIDTVIVEKQTDKAVGQ